MITKPRRRILENVTVSCANKNKTLVRTAVLLTTKCPKNETTNSSTVTVYLLFLFFSILFLITGDLERDEAKHNATRCWKSHVTVDTFVRVACTIWHCFYAGACDYEIYHGHTSPGPVQVGIMFLFCTGVFFFVSVFKSFFRKHFNDITSYPYYIVPSHGRSTVEYVSVWSTPCSKWK